MSDTAAAAPKMFLKSRSLRFCPASKILLVWDEITSALPVNTVMPTRIPMGGKVLDISREKTKITFSSMSDFPPPPVLPVRPPVPAQIASVPPLSTSSTWVANELPYSAANVLNPPTAKATIAYPPGASSNQSASSSNRVVAPVPSSSSSSASSAIPYFLCDRDWTVVKSKVQGTYSIVHFFNVRVSS